MKNVQTRQIAVSFAKALKEELVSSLGDERLADKSLSSFYKVTTDLVRVLKEVHREDLFLEAFSRSEDTASMKLVEEDLAYVLSPIELTEIQVSLLKKVLGKKLGVDVKMKVVLDESIKGGLLIKYKDMEIDLRAESKLKKLLQNFNKN
ncbi:F0F1 ATP synthase subunit delta [Candidatus Dojkabacteria bacterium]|nr:F0F1 ATP synthase subunit delta [Candidatus Dojkabacteria bacterium]